MTEDAYLALERSRSQKHEYLNGEVFAMADGTVAHNLISGNVFAALHTQLRGSGCRVFNSDMRLKVIETGLYTYPDVAIICGGFQFVDDRRDTLTNPVVVIEVLSPSTERYDRGMKFQHYRTIPCLQEYLLIAQHLYQIEHFVRQEHGLWLFEEARGLTAHITIPAVERTLSLSDVYDGVDLQPSCIRGDIRGRPNPA